MARKPAHLELAGGRGPRQRIWEVIRKQAKDFTGPGIEKATCIDLATIRTYVQVLELGGFIEQISARTRFTERQHYRLLRDVGVEAPRLDRKGNVVRPTGNENMWRTMRIMGDFTAAELAIRSSTADIKVAEQTAKTYLHALAVAGYLTVVEEGHPFIRGVGARQSRYRLMPTKYTGPRPPMIQRTKCVYDPNLAKVVWHEEPDHDAC
jgi:hypothetical protein